MEIREVQAKQADEKCPTCNNGWMRPNGIVNQTNPPSYEHSCNSCGATATYGVRYPYTI